MKTPTRKRTLTMRNKLLLDIFLSNRAILTKELEAKIKNLKRVEEAAKEGGDYRHTVFALRSILEEQLEQLTSSFDNWIYWNK